MNGMELGEYVHYHADGYRYFGIGHSVASSITAEQAYQTAKQNIHQLVYTRDLSRQAKILSDKLNDIRVDGLLLPLSNYDQKVNNYVSTVLEENLPLSTIDIGNFDVLERINIESIANLIKDKKLNKYSNVKDGYYITEPVLKKYQKNLTLLYKTLKNEINTNNTKKLIPLLDEVQRIKREIIKIRRSEPNATRFFFNDAQGNDTSTKQVLEDMNALFAYIHAPKAALLGKAGEYGVAALIALLADKTTDVVDDFVDEVEKSVVGEQRSQTVFSNKLHDNGLFKSQLFLDKANIKKIKKGKTTKTKQYSNYMTDANGNVVSVRGSQDTVDISVDLSNTRLGEELGLTELNASIKNYGDVENGSIKAIGGTNLLSVLTILYTPFINHYLNMITKHNEYNYLDKTYSEKLTDADFGGQWKNYNDLIKFTIAARAFAGIRNDSMAMNAKVSDFFIVNDRAHSRFIVIDTYTLLKRIEKNIDQFMRFDGAFPAFGKTENKWVTANSTATGAERRITGLISKLHGRKLSASLRHGALNDIAPVL